MPCLPACLHLCVKLPRCIFVLPQPNSQFRAPPIPCSQPPPLPHPCFGPRPCLHLCRPQHLPDGLLEELLPGPVTLLLQRRPEAPLAAELNPGVSAIGIRIPAAPFIRAVCRQHRSALALTSANISGGTSSIEVAEFEVSAVCVCLLRVCVEGVRRE